MIDLRTLPQPSVRRTYRRIASVCESLDCEFRLLMYSDPLRG